MSWKSKLDKYITSAPDDGFDNWCDIVTDSFSDTFFEKNENWILDNNGVCNTWFNSLFKTGISPEDAAKVIEAFHELL
jgi:hypothetical protein